jgi:hypothetical protein
VQTQLRLAESAWEERGCEEMKRREDGDAGAGCGFIPVGVKDFR